MAITKEQAASLTNQQLQDLLADNKAALATKQGQILLASAANQGRPPALFNLFPDIQPSGSQSFSLSDVVNLGNEVDNNAASKKPTGTKAGDADTPNKQASYLNGLTAKNVEGFDISGVESTGAQLDGYPWVKILKPFVMTSGGYITTRSKAIKEKIYPKHAIVIRNLLAPLSNSGLGYTHIVTSAWRSSGGNHSTGLSVDIQLPGHYSDINANLKVINWIKNNCPVKRIILEGHPPYGTVHLHIDCFDAGESGVTALATIPDARTSSPYLHGIRPDRLFIKTKQVGN